MNLIETVVANNLLGGELWLCAIAKGWVDFQTQGYLLNSSWMRKCWSIEK